jgi:hypothetical protein
MGVPAPKTNFIGPSVTLIETQRKAAINSPSQSSREPRELEDWLEAKPQHYAMLGITADSYDAVVRINSQFSGPLNNLWLNRKQQAAIPDSFDALVEELRKTSLLPNARDNAINALLGITQGTMSYATYSQHVTDFLRRFRRHLQMTLSVFASSADWQAFNFKPKPSPIVHKGAIPCL